MKNCGVNLFTTFSFSKISKLYINTSTHISFIKKSIKTYKGDLHNPHKFHSELKLAEYANKFFVCLILYDLPLLELMLGMQRVTF